MSYHSRNTTSKTKSKDLPTTSKFSTLSQTRFNPRVTPNQPMPNISVVNIETPFTRHPTVVVDDLSINSISSTEKLFINPCQDYSPYSNWLKTQFSSLFDKTSM